MTNAEKYLKDGVDIEEFIKDLHCFWWLNEYDICEGIRKFLSTEAKKKKPTLTEDERVILQSISKEYTDIGYDAGGMYLIELIDTIHSAKIHIDIFNDHLFQFIKEGEEYSIAELLKGE